MIRHLGYYALSLGFVVAITIPGQAREPAPPSGAVAVETTTAEPGASILVFSVASGELGTVVSRPLHGVLQEIGDQWFFEPGPSFWEVGFDYLDYRLGTSIRRVILLAKDRGTPRASFGFETSIESPPTVVFRGDLNRASRSPDAAVSGRYGLSIEVAEGDAYLEASVESFGGGNHGSGGQGGVDPPWPPTGIDPTGADPEGLFQGPTGRKGTSIQYGGGNHGSGGQGGADPPPWPPSGFGPGVGPPQRRGPRNNGHDEVSLPFGGNNHGSGGQSGVDPPWPPAGAVPIDGAHPDGVSAPPGWRLFSFGSGDEIELRMRPVSGGYEVLLRHLDDPPASDPRHDWFFVGKGLRHYAVRFWETPTAPATVTGSYQLRVDGVVIDEGRRIGPSEWPDETFRVGVMDAGFATGLRLDDLEAWTAPWRASQVLLRHETFGRGVPTDLSISSPSTVTTVLHQGEKDEVLLLVPSRGSAWVRDSSLRSRALTTRFALDLSELRVAAGRSVPIVAIGAEDDGQRPVATVHLSASDHGHRLELRGVDDQGRPFSAPAIEVTEKRAVLELLWRAASGPLAHDGRVALWIDGEERAVSVGLDIDRQRAESITIGLLGGEGDVSGAVMIDDLLLAQPLSGNP